jgi:hypothetical protein
MHIAHGDRGTTLVEALVAASLLVALVSGVAYLIIQAHRFTVRAEHMTVAVIATSARLERLRAVPWEYDLAGLEREAPALAMSPSDAIHHDVTGFHETLDHSGNIVANAATAAPAYVRRWSVLPVGDGNRARFLEVCVFAWPAAASAPPLYCLGSVRTRQP